MNSTNLAKRTIIGMTWAYTVFIGGRFATLITTAILARILVPADFGVVGFALLVLNFVDAAQDFGIKDALIYNDQRERDTADTAFWLNILIGIFQYALIWIFAPLALHIIDDGRIVLMLRVMGATFVINAIGNTHDGLMLKNLNYRNRHLPHLYSAFIKGIVSTLLALTGAGVWSLVIGHIVGSIVRTIAKWMLIDWRPRMVFFTDRARALWKYGMYVMMVSLLGIALDQADQMMIGSLLGKVQLGYYSIAARIPETVIANFSLLLTSILFPTYSKIKNDRGLLTQSFLATTKYTALITIPAGFGIAAIAPELVPVFFGEKWIPAVRLLQILAFLGMVVTLPWGVGDVFKAIGRPDISTKLLVIEAAYSFPLIAFFAITWRQAAYASFANLLAMIITAILRLWLVTHYLPVKFTTILRQFASPFIASTVMYGGVTLWRIGLIDVLPRTVVLGTSVLIGGIVCISMLFVLEHDDLIEKRNFLIDLIRNRGHEEEVEEVASTAH